MSTRTQTTKNLDLVYKLMSYLVEDKNMSDLPDNVSYVPFSQSDKSLNKANEKLLKKILEEGNPVVKAEQVNNSWKITPVNFSV
jgi:hypothetical protein